MEILINILVNATISVLVTLFVLWVMGKIIEAKEMREERKIAGIIKEKSHHRFIYSDNGSCIIRCELKSTPVFEVGNIVRIYRFDELLKVDTSKIIHGIPHVKDLGELAEILTLPSKNDDCYIVKSEKGIIPFMLCELFIKEKFCDKLEDLKINP